MRFLKIILFLVCSLVISNCTQSSTVLHDAKGNAIEISSLKGKWIIINYWAAWCEVCLKEIPELNDLYWHNQDKNIVLLGVNYDRMPMNELQIAIAQTHIAYPVVLEDPALTWPLNEVDVLPVTFIIDPKGHVVKKILGGNTEKSLLALVHQLQKTTPA